MLGESQKWIKIGALLWCNLPCNRKSWMKVKWTKGSWPPHQALLQQHQLTRLRPSGEAVISKRKGKEIHLGQKSHQDLREGQEEAYIHPILEIRSMRLSMILDLPLSWYVADTEFETLSGPTADGLPTVQHSLLPLPAFPRLISQQSLYLWVPFGVWLMKISEQCQSLLQGCPGCFAIPEQTHVWSTRLLSCHERMCLPSDLFLGSWRESVIKSKSHVLWR